MATLQLAIDLPPGAETTVAVEHVEQVVLNLCLNARDAITAPGTIVVRARADGDRLVIEVSDDGCGMTAEIVARIWEPYFTTKPHGNGIGLATVRAIVDDAHGQIDVDSRPGLGTTFTVHLPRA